MKKQELIQNLKDLRDSYPNDGRHDGVRQGLLIAIGAIENLEEPKKVIIPKFVADWIEEMKQDERPLYNVMSSLTNKRSHEWTIWKRANMNFSEIVAKAWLEGYQVEKEKLYYVVNGAQQLILVNIGHIVPSYTDFEIAERAGVLKKYQLTEKEIKKYDARYWSFAVEVAE